MRKNRVTQKDILFISVSMFVVILLWVGFNIYHAWATSTISEDLQLQIVPIAPNFDTQTLNKLKTREKIEPIFEVNSQVVASPTAAQDTTLLVPTPTLEEVLPTEEPVPTEELLPAEEPTQTP